MSRLRKNGKQLIEQRQRKGIKMSDILKNCPFCGAEVKVSNGVMGELRFYCCTNRKGCGATISFNNPLANKVPSSTDKYFNRRTFKEV